MSNSNTKQRVSEKQLKSLIDTAVKKINGRKENEVCRYLPVETGGYMHHFTFRKMKGESPEELAEMISKYIIDVSHPKSVRPKPRAPRGSRKRKDHLNFSRQDIDRILNMARMTGDRDIIRKLTRKDLKTAKRELIAAVKQNKVDAELWNAYVEAVTNQSFLEESERAEISKN